MDRAGATPTTMSEGAVRAARPAPMRPATIPHSILDSRSVTATSCTCHNPQAHRPRNAMKLHMAPPTVTRTMCHDVKGNAMR